MKKYNISDLYVLRVQKDYSEHYFICKESFLPGIYIEILSGELISYNESIYQIPLEEFLIKMKHSNSISKKLNKNDILRIYLEVNDKAMEIDECELINIDEILDKAINNFFPETGLWSGDCFSRSTEVSRLYLPCNLRNDLWMANLIRNEKKLNFISINRILQYIKTSDLFKKKRDAYEQKIVKWQIEWMKKGGENWIIDEKYGGDFVFHTSVCDLGFRKGVVDTLSAIGMNIDAIEEGIEKNADKWRNLFMRLAFENEYERIFPYWVPIFSEEVEGKKDRELLEPADKEFKEKWLQLRKYEYYQRHKDSVDKYGKIEPEFTMSSEEIQKLKSELKLMSEQRKKRIEEYENQTSKKPKQLVKK